MSAPTHKPQAQEVKWYVIYVRSRSEKKVAERLERARISFFLPLIKVKKAWSDRVKLVELPLFSGYIFVQTSPSQFTEVRMVEGVVGFVRSASEYPSIPEEQIAAIRHFLETGLPGDAVPDDFETGEMVRVHFGPLMGCEGELIEIRNEKHFIVRIEAIGQVLMVSIPAAYLEKVH